jgi:hypothetical protein
VSSKPEVPPVTRAAKYEVRFESYDAPEKIQDLKNDIIASEFASLGTLQCCGCGSAMLVGGSGHGCRRVVRVRVRARVHRVARSRHSQLPLPSSRAARA